MTAGVGKFMEFKKRCILIITTLVCVLISISAFSQSAWWTYHQDEERIGINTTENLDGGNINLIWTFPRYDADPKYTVDMADSPVAEWSAAGWLPAGLFTLNPPLDYYDLNPANASDNFKWANAVSDQSDPGFVAAQWKFPSGTLQNGHYSIQVWFPSSAERTNTKAAKYLVHSLSGDSVYEIDQTVGGKWVTLGETSFDLDGNSYVELTNITDDPPANNVIVCADAVRFVQDSGMEIYSSPTAARISDNLTATTIPAVWIGTVEKPMSSQIPGVDESGAVYCVRSYHGSATFNWTDIDVLNAGTALWRYPHGGAYDSRYDSTHPYADPATLDRSPIEGPIGGLGVAGGVYSSPTLIGLTGTSADGAKLVAGGMDGQVYCLNASTGDLIWKGPGVTISETTTGWTELTGRYDAFGGKFLYTQCTDSTGSESKAIYDIANTLSDPGSDARDLSGAGHKYAIYVWMPVRLPAELNQRSKDAAYTITSFNPITKQQDLTATIRIDQRDPTDSDTDNLLSNPNAGRWVRVGGSYWNPSRVELSNVTQLTDTTRVVVADAIMVIPEEIGPFSYSTAVSDGTNVYIGNTNGRVYAFKINPSYAASSHIAELAWTFPKVQTVNPASNPEDSTASPFGPIVSSPTYSSGKPLVVTSMDGKVYGITGLNLGETGVNLKWTYDSASEAGSGTEAFSSSAAIYGNKAYVPSTGGRVYAIDVSASGDATASVYPDPASTADNIPLSAFRYSTPVVFNDGQTKIFCGSTGGKVQGFTDITSLDALNDINFKEPNFFSPIQGAIAFDNSNIYIGTMGTGDGEDGGIWWVLRSTGQPGATWPADSTTGEVYSGYIGMGQVFSSPAVANNYMYVGTGKGRLCAFSATAFGGDAWIGGGFEGRNDPPGRRTSSSVVGRDLGEVDIFSTLDFEATLKLFTDVVDLGGNTSTDVNLTSTIFAGGHNRAFGAVSATGDREVYLEWGENIYLIAWHLPPLSQIDGGGISTNGVGPAGKKNSVRFYFNNAGSGESSGSTIRPKNSDYLFEYNSGGETRTVAFAKVEISGHNDRPPSPGEGWTITVRVNRGGTSLSGDPLTRSVDPAVPVPLLRGAPGSWTPTGATFADRTEQSIGINNPLAIQDDGVRPSAVGMPIFGTTRSLGWPTSMWGDGTFQPNRNEITAHFNGNGFIDNTTGAAQWSTQTPQIYLGWAAHGTNSRVGKLGVMDRSAIGLTVSGTSTGALDKFRIQISDLHWMGGNDAVFNLLPWDYPPVGNTVMGYTSRYQKDYPDLTKQSERFQMSGNANPAVSQTTLLPVLPASSGSVDYNTARLRNDNIDTWVEIPQYQPANLSAPGFQAEVTAYLDTNNDGEFNGGEVIFGRPTTYIEAYRKFEMCVDVPPDYHMIVEKPLTIDIVGPDRAPAPHGLGLFLDPASQTEWWKQFTVRNLGNVNLSNIQIAKTLTSGTGTWTHGLVSDSVNPFFPIDATSIWTGGVQTGIVSSFDGWDPTWESIGMEPFLTFGHGYTLSKSRVGDVIPMELTIPDKRKCQEWWTTVTPEVIAKNESSGLGTNNQDPISPSVSVVVPLTQPSGSYSALVPVYADMNPANNILNLGGEPFADPTFRLNVTVAEDRLTGGPTSGSAVQIDEGAPGETYGDTQPTAWRDPVTGETYLFWSTNRFLHGATPSPNLPWFIARAKLQYNVPKNRELGAYDWMPAVGTFPNSRWWLTPPANQELPGFAWPNPVPADMIPETIKHSAPSVALNWDSVGSDGVKAWLFWQGQVDYVGPSQKIERESRIFYTPATAGVVEGTQTAVFNFTRDPSLAKLNPRAFAFNSGSDENIWLLWNGGDAGRWSIYGNLNTSPSTGHDQNAWSDDMQFQTPSCLVSVSDPSPVHRYIGNSTTTDRFIDLTYTGTSKYGQESDIIFTRYQWSGTWDSSLKINPVPLPRVFSEELLRDPKKNVYNSEHLSWLRPPTTGMIDDWGAYSTSPFIRLMLMEDYSINGTLFAKGTIVSATDGSVYLTASDGSISLSDAGTAIAPEIDRATGIYTYSYNDPTNPHEKANALLGQAIIDYSAGIIRFTNALPPSTKAFAEYIPQAKRLTRGPEQDNAPYTFIEKTQMRSPRTGLNPNPGLVLPTQSYTGPTPTDRLWVFWRKPNTSGVQASTLYYKTYRITATLPDVNGDGKPDPIEIGRDGKPTHDVTITGQLGPCEISWDGKKIYFTEVDERYLGMPGTYPGAVNVSYRPVGGSTSTTVNATLPALTWEEELPETALPTRLRVNEGQVWAFADPASLATTKVWVFWSSTRAGESDLYYQTISPNFRAQLF